MGKLRHTLPLLREFWSFAKAHKVYWIVPLVLVLGLMIFVVTASQVTAPFIYTLF